MTHAAQVRMTSRDQLKRRPAIASRSQTLGSRPVRVRASAAAAVIALTVSGCTIDNGTERQASPKPSSSSVAESGSSIPEIVRGVEASVVTIFTDGGLGSGFVYAPRGLIVTNEHVVRGNAIVEVAFADGQRVSGQVRAVDQLTDLAVVEVDRSGLPAVEFRNGLPAVGELAVVLGSPLGLQFSATAGIISGLYREIPGSARHTQSLVNLLQTDAPISPGNSGGPVVDAEGRVVGVSLAYLPPSTGAVALGFAIPSDTVKDVVEQLVEDGRARHAFVGVQPAPITEEVAQRLGVPSTRGVLLLDVVDGSPADKAGLQPGDVITGVGDERVETVEDFLGVLRTASPGDTIRMQVQRDSRTRQVPVVVAARPHS